MCVIIIKPQGVKMLDVSILDACNAANPHGVGYCTTKGKFKKSIRYEDLKKDLLKIEKEESAIIHFRFATQGSVKNSNCHPFFNKDVYFAHNGCLPVKTQKDCTDSEIFFQTQIMPMVDKFGFDAKEVKDVINSKKRFSKFAMMQNEKILLLGAFEKIKGCYFSNLNWQNQFKEYNYNYNTFDKEHEILQKMYENIWQQKQ